MRPLSNRAWAVLLSAAVAVATAAAVERKLADPAVAWLDDAAPAAWIIYPSPPRMRIAALVELDATFATTFRLDAVPPSALLRFRIFRAGAVRVNGVDVGAGLAEDWKTERRVDVAALLRPGDNHVEVHAANASGPPALWLALELPGRVIATGAGGWEASWAGATVLPAVRADEPKRGNAHDPERLIPPAADALRVQWPRLLVFGLLAAAVTGGAALLRRRWPGSPAWSPAAHWPRRLTLAALCVLWVALFVNDSPWLPTTVGFDASAHLEYARFIQERRALPFADDGWQMFQPPLYYLLVAGASSALGVSATAPGAALAVRAVGLAVGLAHMAVLAACLRLLFPDRPRAQVFGLVLGGFLPCSLYLHLVPANEPLVAMVSSAALLVALHLLRRDEPRLATHALLGGLLGLALLAKVTAALLLPPLLGALVVRAMAGDRRWRARRLWAAAASMAVAVATSGWYFGMVWQRLGTPFVGGWDPRRGMGWWLDPGYRTVEDFLRFGRAFVAPAYAGIGGVWDGLYATLWGDGLLSGAMSLGVAPPWWSPSLFSASLVLAVVPMAAVLAGAGTAALRWARRPEGPTGLLVGLAVVVLVAVLWMTVAVPAVVAAKASYGLLALVPFCAFGAQALDRVAGLRRWAMPVVAVAVGSWGLAAFSTYWIDGSSAEARLAAGIYQMEGGERQRGSELVADAVRIAPDSGTARAVLASHLLQAGGAAQDIDRLLEEGVGTRGSGLRFSTRATLAYRQGDLARAEAALREVIALEPNHLKAHMQIASLRASAGDPASAVRELREALRIDPQHVPAHAALAGVYAALGDLAAASTHQAWAERLRAAR